MTYRFLEKFSKAFLVIFSDKIDPVMWPILLPELEMELNHVFCKPHNISKKGLLLLFISLFSR